MLSTVFCEKRRNQDWKMSEQIFFSWVKKLINFATNLKNFFFRSFKKLDRGEEKVDSTLYDWKQTCVPFNFYFYDPYINVEIYISFFYFSPSLSRALTGEILFANLQQLFWTSVVTKGELRSRSVESGRQIAPRLMYYSTRFNHRLLSDTR